MATWTDIEDLSLETGKPVRAVDALAFKNNPIAIAVGATGAPKIQEEALESGVVNNLVANIAAGAIGSYAFMVESNGNDLRLGQLRAGSSLEYASVVSPTLTSTTSFGRNYRYGTTNGSTSDVIHSEYTQYTPSGTWVCLGGTGVSVGKAVKATLFKRVS